MSVKSLIEFREYRRRYEETQIQILRFCISLSLCSVLLALSNLPPRLFKTAASSCARDKKHAKGGQQLSCAGGYQILPVKEGAKVADGQCLTPFFVNALCQHHFSVLNVASDFSSELLCHTRRRYLSLHTRWCEQNRCGAYGYVKRGYECCLLPDIPTESIELKSFFFFLSPFYSMWRVSLTGFLVSSLASTNPGLFWLSHLATV